RVLGIALDKAVVRVGQGVLAEGAVLGEVVQADDVVPGVKQFFDEIAADEARRPRDENPHACPSRTEPSCMASAGAQAGEPVATQAADGAASVRTQVMSTTGCRNDSPR